VRFPSAQVRPGSVSQDWRRPLSSRKSDLYVQCLQNLEVAYTMFSVSLDEALGMRRLGRFQQALQLLNLSPQLCNRLAVPLGCLLRTMQQHAKHFGVAPNLVPLNPENFQSLRSQRVARFNELFSKVLLTKKSQFVNKISSLEDLVEELDSSFGATAQELLEEESFRPERDWEQLDAAHYDLNTCLREAVVLYKSFLHALPTEQLAEFEVSLQTRCEATEEEIVARTRNVAHRRIAFLKGQ